MPSVPHGFDRFIGDPEYLSGVVRFDRPRLGDLTGRRGVHLQCHIGTDTLSLTRLGARMTGLDFSSAALAHARRLAERAGTAPGAYLTDAGEWRLATEPERLAASYTMQAIKA